jgi:hypothetical protein
MKFRSMDLRRSVDLSPYSLHWVDVDAVPMRSREEGYRTAFVRRSDE